MTTIMPPSDDDLRDALRREPSSGLAWLVADAVADEVAQTPQQRTMPSIGAWGRPADYAVGTWPRRVLIRAAVVGLVAATGVAAVLVGSLLRHPTPLRNGSIAVAPPEGGVVVIGGEQPLADGAPGEPGTSLAWSPDGGRLAFWSGAAADPASGLQGYAWQLAILDVRSGSIERPITEGLPRALEPNGPIQWSADGRRLLVGVLADGSPTVLVADPATGRFTRLGAPDTDTIVASWSPDGRRLASVAERRFANDWHLDIASADGADARSVPLQLPSGFRLSGAGAEGGLAMQMGFPLAWSPDGRRLLVTASSDRETTMTFDVDIADGSTTAVTPASVNPVITRWSPAVPPSRSSHSIPPPPTTCTSSTPTDRACADSRTTSAGSSSGRRTAASSCSTRGSAGERRRSQFEPSGPTARASAPSGPNRGRRDSRPCSPRRQAWERTRACRRAGRACDREPVHRASVDSRYSTEWPRLPVASMIPTLRRQ